MWECGLKHCLQARTVAISQSLLMWECGLKHILGNVIYTLVYVTPYVGVWIETSETEGCAYASFVTPYVGVWIETLFYTPVYYRYGSHSLCGSVD